MSKKRGFLETYVLGIADDIPSTNRLLVVSRLTHWVCFLLTLGAALTLAKLYFDNGRLWNEPEGVTNERNILQALANEGLWLFVTGVALIAGFISWLNTDVLMNRKILLEQAEQTSTADTAVVRAATPVSEPSPTQTIPKEATSSETPTGATKG